MAALRTSGFPTCSNFSRRRRSPGTLHLQAPENERRGLIRLGSGAVDGAYSDLRRQARPAGWWAPDWSATTRSSAPPRTYVPGRRAWCARCSTVKGSPLTTSPGSLQIQATDAVCELLRWSAGTFSFHVGEDDPDGLGLGLRAEELVAEGQRRMEVWPNADEPDPVARHRAAPGLLAGLRPRAAHVRSGGCSRSSTGSAASTRSSRSSGAASSRSRVRWQRSSSGGSLP